MDIRCKVCGRPISQETFGGAFVWMNGKSAQEMLIILGRAVQEGGLRTEDPRLLAVHKECMQ